MNESQSWTVQHPLLIQLPIDPALFIQISCVVSSAQFAQVHSCLWKKCVFVYYIRDIKTFLDQSEIKVIGPNFKFWRTKIEKKNNLRELREMTVQDYFTDELIYSERMCVADRKEIPSMASSNDSDTELLGRVLAGKKTKFDNIYFFFKRKNFKWWRERFVIFVTKYFVIANL